MTIKSVNQVITNDYAIYEGDCVELIKSIPDNSIHFTIFSPPFVGLYKFSDSYRDMSNSDGPEFWEHFGFLIEELMRVTKPGRVCSVHCMQLPTSKTRNGFIGMYDFRGDIIRAFQDKGWLFHSEVCIFKDPVIAQQRTKSIRLLHKQLAKDASLSGQGLADYIVSFRKPGENEEAIAGQLSHWSGDDSLDVSDDAYRRHRIEMEQEGRKPWDLDQWRSILIWQRYASPVWMDIDQTRTLQNRRFNPAAQDERDEHDEQHISPLQLDVIERCIDLWSLPGETVLTPFLGIGSETYCAVQRGRKGIGFELKPSYFAQAKRNMEYAKREDDQFTLTSLG